MSKHYILGFMNKCADNGIDVNTLIKQAQIHVRMPGGVRKAETASRLRASGEPVATRILRT